MKKHLMDAFERLKHGTPQNSQLAELSKIGKLKVNILTVSKEAGVSRTLIGFEECRYPEVRSAILGKTDEKNALPKTDLRVINKDLREKNQILEQRLKASLAEQAAMINRMLHLENEYKDKQAEIERVNARNRKNPNEVIGLRIVKNQLSKTFD